eukprot:TRINITY_DN4655_c0_g1_i2.p1 TRINITY_DN4655_c0_g1~~TRINITY_DN4655_c0_g1_i2.p1  ORF type:complete len:453 (-),score=158.31 TRINITY_DN4655_c0_g1_i2:60-1418(-)
MEGTDNKNEWSSSSWRKFAIKQQPEYKDSNAVERALEKVRALPPLVHPKEVETLKNYLALAAKKKMFLLQGGDCAERFVDCSKSPIENKFKILLQMSLIILWGSRTPVVRVARMAGQFAKPRTSNYETVNGEQVFSFKGDNINDFDVKKREPDPDRMVQAYFHSAATLNYIRAMITGGVADLHDPRAWTLDFVQKESTKKEYEGIIEKITEGLSFLDLIDQSRNDSLSKVEFFTSHEGLLLGYEEALTSQYKDQHYNLGAHFLWIGDRTRDIDGAHVEYFRGIANPIGIKLGPSTKEEDILRLLPILNPNREEGKLTLITRYGATNVEKLLPAHIAAVKSTGVPVLWICDPCHGNTETSPSGLKTRSLEKMTAELMATFQVHANEGSHLGGVHLEMTGDNVTECIGGSSELNHTQLSTNYETFCDPRLNYTQSLDIAFAISEQMQKRSKSQQ